MCSHCFHMFSHTHHACGKCGNMWKLHNWTNGRGYDAATVATGGLPPIRRWVRHLLASFFRREMCRGQGDRNLGGPPGQRVLCSVFIRALSSFFWLHKSLPLLCQAGRIAMKPSLKMIRARKHTKTMKLKEHGRSFCNRACRHEHWSTSERNAVIGRPQVVSTLWPHRLVGYILRSSTSINILEII